MSAPKSKLYAEMLTRHGAKAMSELMTFGRACDLIGAVQDNALMAHTAQRKAVEALSQRIALLENQQGYTVTGTDKAGKPRVKALQ